ncbi:MAG: hypothetical protein EB120_07295 [Proteobacteria bacterium]|nr:hypothetical protein [Pseudomonadota bacterium]
MTKRLLVLCMTATTALSFGGNLSLKDLKAKMAEREASWIPAESRITQLSEKEKKNLFGLQLDEGFGDFFKPAKPVAKDRAVPAKFDWRNKDGKNYDSPILNQANCGSCVAFSAVAALETQVNITQNTWGDMPLLSSAMTTAPKHGLFEIVGEKIGGKKAIFELLTTMPRELEIKLGVSKCLRLKVMSL